MKVMKKLFYFVILYIVTFIVLYIALYKLLVFPAHSMGQPRGVQSCDHHGNCHYCAYVGSGTYACR
jgi:hypothetical protein